MKFKLLGLSLVAVLAVSALGANSASADKSGHFTWSGADSINVHGEQIAGIHKNEFHYGNFTLTCAQATIEGNLSSVTRTVSTLNASVTIGPTGGCAGAFGATTHVTMNGCTLNFYVGASSAAQNTSELICPGTSLVEMHVNIPILADCTLTIKPQPTKTGGIRYTTGSSGETHDITADITVEGIHIVRHGNSLCGSLTGETASLTAQATVKGFNAASGAQVGITATGANG